MFHCTPNELARRTSSHEIEELLDFYGLKAEDRRREQEERDAARPDAVNG